MHASGVKLPSKRTEASNESVSGTAAIESKGGDIGLPCLACELQICQIWASRRKSTVCRSSLGPRSLGRYYVGPWSHWSVWLRSDSAYRIARASKHSRNTDERSNPQRSWRQQRQSCSRRGTLQSDEGCPVWDDGCPTPHILHRGGCQRMQPLVCRMQVPHPLDASLAA